MIPVFIDVEDAAGNKFTINMSLVYWMFDEDEFTEITFNKEGNDTPFLVKASRSKIKRLTRKKIKSLLKRTNK